MDKRGGVTEVRVTPLTPAAPTVVVNVPPSVTAAPFVTAEAFGFTLTAQQLINLLSVVNPGLAAVLRANPTLAAQVAANALLVNLLLTNPTVANIMAACPALLAQVAVNPFLTSRFAAVFGFPFFGGPGVSFTSPLGVADETTALLLSLGL